MYNLSVTAKAERFSNGSSLRLNPPVTYGDSPPNSGALGREMTFDSRGEQQQTIMYNRKIFGFARGSPTRGADERSESEGFRQNKSAPQQSCAALKIMLHVLLKGFLDLAPLLEELAAPKRRPRGFVSNKRVHFEPEKLRGFLF